MCKKYLHSYSLVEWLFFFWRFMCHPGSWTSWWFRGASSWSTGIHASNPRNVQVGICSLLSVFGTLASEFTACRPMSDLAGSYLNLIYHKSHHGGKTVELSRPDISDYLLSSGQETDSWGTVVRMMKQLILCGKIQHASMQPESCCSLVFEVWPKYWTTYENEFTFPPSYLLYLVSSEQSKISPTWTYVLPSQNMIISHLVSKVRWFCKQVISVGDVWQAQYHFSFWNMWTGSMTLSLSLENNDKRK